MTDMLMPFASFCSVKTCQTLILKGSPVYKTGPGEYAHAKCPNSRRRHMAPHKHPDTGMKIDGTTVETYE